MRIYLDTCCYNRPYDKQDQLLVKMEALCKVHIQDLIESGEHELVSSYMLDYECSNIPDEERRAAILQFIRDNAEIRIEIGEQEEVERRAAKIMRTGIRFKDACHVASAILAGCDHFISTDKRLLRYRTREIRMVSPIQFIVETEGIENAQDGL